MTDSNESCPTCGGGGFIAWWEDGNWMGECCPNCEEFYMKEKTNG